MSEPIAIATLTVSLLIFLVNSAYLIKILCTKPRHPEQPIVKNEGSPKTSAKIKEPKPKEQPKNKRPMKEEVDRPPAQPPLKKR